MNAQTPISTQAAMALYSVACETHQRRDWREACHALAAVLQAQEAAPTVAKFDPPLVIAPAKPKAKAPKAKAEPVAMSYQMTGESLSKALRLINMAVDPRSTILILAQVRLEARGGVLTLTGTDLDDVVEVDVEAPGIGEWTVCVGGAELAKLMANMKGPVALVGKRLEPFKAGERGTLVLDVSAGTSTAQLTGLDPADFPVIEVKKCVPVDCAPVDLSAALAFVQSAISDEETRYYLNGAFLHLINGALAMVATDGHRMNVIDMAGSTMGAPDKDQRGFILPRESVKIMLAMLKAAPGGLSVHPQQLALDCGAVRLRGKMIDGSFPPYERVVPARQDTPYLIDAKALAGAVKRVAAIHGKERSRAVTLDFKAGLLEISAKSMDGVAASEQVGYTGGGSGALRHGFNSTYILEALASLGAETIEWHLSGPNKRGDFLDPSRMEAAGAPGRLCVIMPRLAFHQSTRASPPA